MAKFRSLPREIEAVKVPMREYADHPLVFAELPDWLRDACAQEIVTAEFRNEDYWYYLVKTLEGTMTATPGDWLILGVEGEIYPCKPSIFAKHYEPAE